MAGHEQIIKLYTELAQNPNKDFGWDKGVANAISHNYKKEWIEKLPSSVWQYCAAVGNPFEFGEIRAGETVLDLGCGAGVDVLVSVLLVGNDGKVIGVDITPKMVEKAREHAVLAGFENVEILESSFDALALEDESVDVVISNGAINLTSCKESVFAEIYRVLKPQGKLMFSDMIDTSSEEKASSCCCVNAEEGDWANCIAGTLKKEELINMIQKAGFTDVAFRGSNHYTTSKTTYGASFSAKKLSPNAFRQTHWDTLFQTKDYTQVLWHQESPAISLHLINKYVSKENFIIDVGCGASFLVDNLLEYGYKNLALLDTSHISLEIVKKRLQENAFIPTYICSDILNFKSSTKFNIWHDRAVFHFLLQKKEREKYFEVLKESLYLGSVAIISTFRVGGQTQCAGLDIVQYDEGKMRAELPEGMELISYNEFVHLTPKQTQQKYCSFVIRKTLDS